MINIKINNKEVQVSKGVSVMSAAKQAGENIPAMCWHEELEHYTSCMVCLVKDASTGKLFPSCSVKATEGMEVITLDDEIYEGRKTALELLLSEHVGDCEAPCQTACPAHMGIPQMNRLIAEGKFRESLQVVMQDIALPSVLGRICPAPCEGACRRKSIDEAVSICLLKRFVGDEAYEAVFKSLEIQPLNGKKVAVIGSGPAGLAAAFNLQLRGYSCTIFEKEGYPGGLLRTGIADGKLPGSVLDREINNILSLGVRLNLNEDIDAGRFAAVREEYDAVVLATGNLSGAMKKWGLDTTEKGVRVNKNTYETSEEGIFAVGNALRPSRLAVRSVGQGKEAAFSVDQFLSGKTVKGEPGTFNSRFGRLIKDEFAEYLKESVPGRRFHPKEGIGKGFSVDEVKKEALRCLHCDCRKIDNCKLRDFSDEYKANQRRFSFGERKRVVKHINHDMVIYESQKCIKCGICVRLTEKHGEKFGFTFIGRGFDVVVGVPFNEELKKGLTKTAKIVVEGCPTGAISMK
ncbi:Glutamate synthase [NADPH] small chain [hydrothermal vent metagenome]|uniref:Glutamate synthase [NADPH] small chain n=1 Tax=hydrothermal vent metagenome TaxID=652676 RepID=A0A3B0U0W8_9ZZZZ